MARPMLLMQEVLLSELWAKQQVGVPVSTLIQQELLDITPPTLTKLLRFMSILEQEELKENPDIYEMIYNSMFPDWLTSNEEVLIMTQPNGAKYIGKFPLGKWITIETKTINVGTIEGGE